jgi:hypothetical protein
MNSIGCAVTQGNSGACRSLCFCHVDFATLCTRLDGGLDRTEQGVPAHGGRFSGEFEDDVEGLLRGANIGGRR